MSDTLNNAVALPVLKDNPALSGAWLNETRSLSLSPEQQKAVQAIIDCTRLSSVTDVISFGSQPQKKLSSMLDQMLANTTVDDAGIAGELTVSLSRSLDMIQIRQMKAELDGKRPVMSLLSKTFLGRYVSAIQGFFVRRTLILKELAKIVEDGEKRRTMLVDRLSIYGRMIDAYEKILPDFETYLIAGSQILSIARADFEARRNALAALPPEARDPAKMSQLHDISERIVQFETRLVGLDADYSEAIQTGPVVKNSAKGTEIALQSVLSSILSDVTRLKTAIIAITGTDAARKSMAQDAKARKVSQELAQIAATGAKDLYLEGKRSQGDFADRLSHIETITKTLTETLESGAEIDKKTAIARNEAHQRMVELRNDLADSLEKASQAILA